MHKPINHNTATTEEGTEMKKLLEVMQKIEKNLEQLQNNCTSGFRTNKPRQTHMGTNKNKPKQQMLPCPGNDNAGQQHSHGFTIECFRCGKPGHDARNYHVPIITGHMQVAMQPQNQLQQSPQQQLETLQE